MPTLSASDYTQYLKFKAASASPIRPAIQTRDNATLSQSVLNANVLASQAAFVTTPYSVTVSPPVTVTTARTNIVSTATANGSIITYTCSQAHGLSNGDTVIITGFSGNLSPDPNRSGIVTVTNATTFVIPAPGTVTGTATGTGSIVGRLYYTTSTDHNVYAGVKNVSVTGLTTSAFNLINFTVLIAPTTTTFVVAATVAGTAATSQSGVLTVQQTFNPTTTILNNARVIAPQVVQTRSNPEALSTVSWTSGTSGSVGSTTSSKFVQSGGLPANNKVSTYTRLPQNAGW